MNALESAGTHTKGCVVSGFAQPALSGPQRQLQGLGVFRKGVFVTLLILQSTLPAPDFHIIDRSAWSGGLR